MPESGVGQSSLRIEKQECQVRFSFMLRKLPFPGNGVSFLAEIDNDYLLLGRDPSSGDKAQAQNQEPDGPDNIS